MAVLLSAKKLAWARRTFNIFNLFNSFSFVFVSGSIITLFALRMGASTSIIGLLNALVYITFFMLPLGKRMVRHASIIKVFGWGWVIRYIALLPILFAPCLPRGDKQGWRSSCSYSERPASIFPAAWR